MRLLSFLTLSAIAGFGATINSLSYISGGCVTTIADGCAPIGVTLAGSTSNPFLNDTGNKAINLGTGSYYTFNDSFFGTGASLMVAITLSDLTSLSQTVTLPDLSVAGNTVVHFTGAEDILITTTGIGNADRMSFGFAPGAFNPSGTNDIVFQLVFNEGDSVATPEPGTLLPVVMASLFLLRTKIRRLL